MHEIRVMCTILNCGINNVSKPTHILIEDADAAVISDVSVPDLTPDGWLFADQYFLQIEGQEKVGEVYFPGTEGLEVTSVIEFAVADIPANSLLADIDNYDLDYFDLNDLLKQAEPVAEGPMKPVLDGPGMESAVAETAHEAESSPSDVSGLPINMAFPQLTIVIDDEADPMTVAI